MKKLPIVAFLALLACACSNAATQVVSDPCKGISEDGVCVGEDKYQACVVDIDGEQPPELITFQCESYEKCGVTDGEANCELRPERCIPGSSRCFSADTIELCGEGETWAQKKCDVSCNENPLAAYCSLGPAVTALAEKTWTLNYMARDINTTTWDRWTDPAPVNAAGVLVVSRRGETPLDSVLTGIDGSFKIKVPSPAQAGDVIAVFPVRPSISASKVGVLMAVANPGLSQEKHNIKDALLAKSPSFWSWEFDLTSALPETLTITEKESSGVMRVFDQLNRLMTSVSDVYNPKGGQPLSIWMQSNVTWSCGACQWTNASSIAGFDFTRQIYFPMDPENEGYWSLAVNSHEFGHYVMSSWGTTPGEGGQHCFSKHYPPGLVWSEGWATWHSAESRRDTGYGKIYYSKQRGSFFTFDIQARQYSSGRQWVRPTPGEGLLQNMDENEVSAMGWSMTSGQVTKGSFFNALASQRMMTSPFKRGYKTHKWDVDADCEAVDIRETDRSAPMFADFLDALVCGGTQAALVDAATEPAKYYPYPSSNPICQ